MAVYACRPCQISHSSCDNYRPCHNCVRKGIQDNCITIEHRRRGRPGKHEREQQKPSLPYHRTIQPLSANVMPEYITMVVTPDLQRTIQVSPNSIFADASTLPSLHDITSVYHAPRLASLQAKLSLGEMCPRENVSIVDRYGRHFASTLSLRWLIKNETVSAEMRIVEEITPVPTLPFTPSSGESSRSRTSISALCDI
ncbi:hypothetical protein E3Q02_01916 [Wallemia mellicola]|uniref:Transcription activator of gluconeogenesis ERT1 n=1 Tax=Wallemia mellicola TaxID=1708541 RepID=A0AB38MV73_9BASI|nr:hypothetical protein E3Q02_01916 [Wallemia mellicola]